MQTQSERWAVVYSFTMREEIKPFQGCYRVIGETKFFIEIRIERISRDGTEIEIRKVKKSNVVAYFPNDVSNFVTEANAEVEDSYRKHISLKDKKVTLMKVFGLSEAA